MSSKSLVSVVIPCYNAANWIAETIEAVLSQSHKPIEIVVVDDGSTDASLTILQFYKDRIHYVSQANKGLPYARNRGLELSNGDYILYLDADDLMATDHIAVMVEALQKKSNHIAVSDWWLLENRNNTWEKVKVGSEKPLDGDPIKGILEMFLNPKIGWGVPPHAVLWPRNIAFTAGRSDDSLPNATEIDCFLQALTLGIEMVLVSGGGAYYRYHGKDSASLSATISSKRARSIMNILVKLENKLEETKRLDKYRLLLGRVYYAHAEHCILNDLDADIINECLDRSKRLAGNRAVTGTFVNRLLSALIGPKHKENLARFLIRIGIATRARRQHKKTS
ncbi:MAG: hypothetical protein DPW16_11200 [Chloroflexi bacterium]|nr:hypothetical protein [Chloroflexota bacterium]